MNIDETYFVNDIVLPDSAESNLENDIARYEPEILKELLGYELWGLTNSETSTRMTELIEGKEYTVSYNGRDQTIKWNGLQNSELISLIAYYVYYWVQRNNVTHTTSLGELTSKQENSMIAIANQKIGNAWHRMRQLFGYVGQNELEPSAYNFLKANEDTYEEWVFTDIGKVNQFGI